jgi:hypothetical protein
MAEIIGEPQQAVEVSGAYGCSSCGHRIELQQGDAFPENHHADHPWTLMVKADS